MAHSHTHAYLRNRKHAPVGYPTLFSCPMPLSRLGLNDWLRSRDWALDGGGRAEREGGERSGPASRKPKKMSRGLGRRQPPSFRTCPPLLFIGIGHAVLRRSRTCPGPRRNCPSDYPRTRISLGFEANIYPRIGHDAFFRRLEVGSKIPKQRMREMPALARSCSGTTYPPSASGGRESWPRGPRSTPRLYFCVDRRDVFSPGFGRRGGWVCWEHHEYGSSSAYGCAGKVPPGETAESRGRFAWPRREAKGEIRDLEHP